MRSHCQRRFLAVSCEESGRHRGYRTSLDGELSEFCARVWNVYVVFSRRWGKWKFCSCKKCPTVGPVFGNLQRLIVLVLFVFVIPTLTCYSCSYRNKSYCRTAISPPYMSDRFRPSVVPCDATHLNVSNHVEGRKRTAGRPRWVSGGGRRGWGTYLKIHCAENQDANAGAERQARESQGVTRL